MLDNKLSEVKNMIKKRKKFGMAYQLEQLVRGMLIYEEIKSIIIKMDN
jgi:hypothetical protein